MIEGVAVQVCAIDTEGCHKLNMYRMLCIQACWQYVTEHMYIYVLCYIYIYIYAHDWRPACWPRCRS